MVWIALIVIVALAAGALGTLLELALWAVVLTALAIVGAGLLLVRSVGPGRRSASR